jgi:cytidyltransferase-like protein
MKKKVIIVSGYFNPIHKGHIEYFKLAKSLGDLLYVIVNNDEQREKKGSKEFILQDERIIIVNALEVVDKVYLSIDRDKDVAKTIKKIFNENNSKYSFAFANGGDQFKNTIPENKICAELGIELIDGLGEKIQSSSWILKDK